MSVYYYIAVAAMTLLVIWRMVAGFKKGMVQELLSLIAMGAAGVCAVLILSAIGSYLNKEIGRLFQIVVVLIVVCAVYRLMNLLFTSMKLISKLPIVHSLDKVLGAVFGIAEGIVIVVVVLDVLKKWGLSLLE